MVVGASSRAPSSLSPSLRSRLRRHAGSVLVESFFRGASGLGRRVGLARFERHGIEVLRDLPYLKTGRPEHTLDVYRPLERSGPLPVVLYVHGGGFRILSKDTHWVFGLELARRGFLVVNINYRLAPTYPFPAALEDVSDAFRWTLENAALFGGDPDSILVAGESAGANLVTSLTLACCFEHDAPFARAVHELGVVPRAVLAACGLFEVGNYDRFRDKGLSRFILDRIAEVGHAYRDTACCPEEWLSLCDPLVFLESGPAPKRPLPPFFLPCGDADPLVDDTRRMKRALEALSVPVEAPEYPRMPHAFHAFVITSSARQCWRDHDAFLERVLRAPVGSASAMSAASA
jgi:acetyl esterase